MFCLDRLLPGIELRGRHRDAYDRRRDSAEMGRVLSARPGDLDDLDGREALPSVLLLCGLAAILQVPVPLLVDSNATPLKVLRALAAGRPRTTDAAPAGTPAARAGCCGSCAWHSRARW